MGYEEREREREGGDKGGYKPLYAYCLLEIIDLLYD